MGFGGYLRVGKGRLNIGVEFVHESLIGTLFDCRVDAGTQVGSYSAIKPSVPGRARMIGHNMIFVDDRDRSPSASARLTGGSQMGLSRMV